MNSLLLPEPLRGLIFSYRWALLGLLLVATTLVYEPAASGGFILDDMRVIPGALSSTGANDGFLTCVQNRCFSLFTFRFSALLFGSTPEAFHRVDIALHLLCGVLIFLLTHTLLKRFNSKGTNDRLVAAALLATAIFLLHPIQTQAVNYATQRMAQLSCLFSILAMLAYHSARTADLAYLRLSYTMAAIGAFVLALFSKPNAVALPVVFIVFELLLFRRRPHFKAYLLSLLFLCVAALAIGLFVGLQRIDTPRVTPVAYFLTQIVVVARYLWLLIFPVDQSFDHVQSVWPNLSHWQWIVAAVVHLLLLVITLMIARRHRFIALGLVIFYAGLAVESGIIPLRDVMVEHRIYLPMVGISLLVAAAAYRSSARVWIVHLLVLGALSMLSLQRNTVWATTDQVWANALEVDTLAPRALTYFTKKALVDSAWSTAVPLAKKTLRAYPTNVTALNTIALNLARENHEAASVRMLQRALKLEPKQYMTHIHLGIIQTKRGKLGEAENALKAAMRLEPKLPDAHFHLAKRHAKAGEYARARAQLEQALTYGFDSCKVRKAQARIETIHHNDSAAAQLMKECSE